MNEKEFIRRKIVEIVIKESDLTQDEKKAYLLKEDYALFKQSFIDPFADVFKVAWLSMKRVLLASTRLFLSIITFRQERMQQIARDYKARDERLAGEVNAVVEKATQAAGPGLSFAKFTFNPGMYLAEVATQNVDWNSTKQFLIDTGFDQMPIINRAMDVAPQNYWQEMKGLQDAIIGPIIKGTAIANVGTELAKLFIGGLVSESIIREQDEKESKEGIESEDDLRGQQLVDFVQELYKRAGFFDAVEKWRTTLLEERKQHFSELVNEALPVAIFTGKLVDVSNFEELEKLVSESGLKDINLDEIKSSAEKEFEEVVKDEKKVKKFLDKSVKSGELSKKDSEEMSVKIKEGDPEAIKKLKPMMEKVFWMGSKDDLVTQMSEGLQQLKDIIEETFNEFIPEEDIAIIQGSSVGKSFLDDLNQKKQEFDEALKI